MIKELSITKISEREATVSIPLQLEYNPNTIEYNNYIRTCTSFLTDTALFHNLTICIYKVEIQKIIVFYFRGSEENIKNFIKSFD